MKLPSIQYLISQAKTSFKRFPLSIIASFIAVAVAVFLIERDFKADHNIFPYINIMLSMSIAIPLYFCTTVIADKRSFSKKRKLMLQIFASLLLVLIYFSLPNAESTHNTSMPYIKYALYNITAHLLVAFVPFLNLQQINGFWNYNKQLFIRLNNSFLYSSVIVLGLLLALFALNLLFEIKIHEQLYAEIWIVGVGFLNTWFFVSGIPSNFDALDEDTHYPKGLKIFAQYILLPLLTLYMIILYAYGSKIMLQWNWPKGMVTYMIICVAVAGIFNFLLLYPYGTIPGNEWIKKAAKGYYFLLMPLIVFLFIAIFMRVNKYGITIDRYAIILLGIWLSILCLYTAFGKTNIKFIPSSLALLLLLISFGPWGLLSVSERSQVNRLKQILEQSKILVNNKIQQEVLFTLDSNKVLSTIGNFKNEEKINDSLHNEIKSILSYLDNHHGFAKLRGWYTQNLDSLIDIQERNKKEYNKLSEAAVYMNAMGLNNEYRIIREASENTYTIDYSTASDNVLETVSGYDYVVAFNQSYFGENDLEIKSFTLQQQETKLEIQYKPQLALLLRSEKASIASFDLASLITSLKAKKIDTKALADDDMQMQASSKNYNFTLRLDAIAFEKDKLSYISGILLIKKK